MNNLTDLFQDQLKMLYSVETQMIDALQNMQGKASDNQLKEAFNDHLKQTKTQKERLEEISDDLEQDFSGKTCQAMKGLIQETEDFLSKDLSDAVKDAGLIVHAQQVEHHEIASYGSVCAFAEELGYDSVKKKLEETLTEEKNTDEKLDDLANRLNSIANE